MASVLVFRRPGLLSMCRSRVGANPTGHQPTLSWRDAPSPVSPSFSARGQYALAPAGRTSGAQGASVSTGLLASFAPAANA
eukprot:8295777-Alexandrium_andersonii.AAC.1